jgi:hypothetical protein
VEALAQRNFWIGRTGYLSDGADRLIEADGTKNYVPVAPFHYGDDGRLHVVFMGSGYYAAQVCAPLNTCFGVAPPIVPPPQEMMHGACVLCRQAFGEGTHRAALLLFFSECSLPRYAST